LCKLSPTDPIQPLRPPPLYAHSQIISGYYKFREVSQQVRLGLHVIEIPPLQSPYSIIVKLLFQADQVLYQGEELALWTGDTVIPDSRGF
jgi:hypothetical protein